jgi:hypothetical protein
MCAWLCVCVCVCFTYKAYERLIHQKTGKTCAVSFADYFDVVIDQGNRMRIPVDWPGELNSLLTKCWDVDPGQCMLLLVLVFVFCVS